MYTERDVHRLPHFHVYYGEHQASFALNPPALFNTFAKLRRTMVRKRTMNPP
ncbi:MAG: DUF4160 domain-containing protein [Anaerolineales bacterium]|nr:DUF4160 domain-containing protein [Anaerolineales bacterium]